MARTSSDKEEGLKHADLLRAMRYDPVTGLFTWLGPQPHHPNITGNTACRKRSDGYRVVNLFGRRYLAHRLAVFYVTGAWPASLVDHRDTDRSNNAWENLRGASRTGNMANSRLHPCNTSGFKGVSFHKPSGKWRASITENGVSKSLGYFTEPLSAAEAYDEAAELIFGSYARTNVTLLS